ncbi:MAG: universal stress protein [Ideonella sp.]|nr:universal stress protein [Ideonella sp.]
MKILLAVDGSPYTKKMLAYLATHDELFGPQNTFTIFTAVAALPPRARSAVGADIARGYYKDEASKVHAPVSKFLSRHGIKAEICHEVGAAGELIAKAAEKGHCDLVMMGSHGHGAFGSLVMGSVATRVLAHCKVPVLLVR